MSSICHYEHFPWRTPDGNRVICTCGGCMEPQKRAEMDTEYNAALEATRMAHKRERMRRMVKEGRDAGLSATQK